MHIRYKSYPEKRGPDLSILKIAASEAFMPICYGGGINTCQKSRSFYIGYEKIIINTAFINNPSLVTEAVKLAGSQSIVISIDVKNDLWDKVMLYLEWFCKSQRKSGCSKKQKN